MGNNTVTVTDASFTQDVLESTKPVLVDFWAESCAPCRMVAPVLEEIAGENADTLIVAKLDAEANPVAARDYQVIAMPTLLLFREGKPVKRLVGAKSKAVLMRELSDVLG